MFFFWYIEANKHSECIPSQNILIYYKCEIAPLDLFIKIKHINYMENIEQFVDRLVLEKGFNESDAEVIEEIKKDLLARVEARINAMIMSELPPDSIEDFEEIMDKGSDDDVHAFMKKVIPNIEEKVAKELYDFKNMYLG